VSEAATIPVPGYTRLPLNLRRWFVVFLVWMGALTAIASISLAGYESGSGPAGKVWLLAVYAFYMSLCCTFLPLPTTWIVLLLASNEVALVQDPLWRAVIVASAGAIGTMMANLNEYHLLTYLLRKRRVGRVRQTRWYRVAAEWFSVSPFTVLLAIALVPIPVDVVRWLAIAYRYPRTRYATAYGVGRWLRYALLAGVAIWLDLSGLEIFIIQAVIVVAAATKFISSWRVRRRDRNTADRNDDVDLTPVPVEPTTASQENSA
jgi:membrane protein YqaA with SNARE-associated domain